jgi:hypothetical protein
MKEQKTQIMYLPDDTAVQDVTAARNRTTIENSTETQGDKF